MSPRAATLPYEMIMELQALELRYLRYFVTLAEELNYRRTAERLHISTGQRAFPMGGGGLLFLA